MNSETRPLTGSTDVRLEDLLNYYRRTVRLHRTVHVLCRSDQHKHLFKKCLNHELKVIRSRSQDLEDHEISIYQKAFATLMNNGEDHMAGLELYAEEILGLKSLRAGERNGVLRQAMEIRHLATEKIDIRGSPESYESNIYSVPHSKESGTSQLESRNFRLPYKLQDNDPKLHRLWNLYQGAKEDFLSTAESDWPSHTSSAKFLRDTAENCINYIQSKQYSNKDRLNAASASDADSAERLLKELYITVKVAKEAAEKGSGGKKRRFDHDMEGVPRGPRRLRAGTTCKTSICYLPLPTPQKPRLDDDGPRQHAERRRRDSSQDYAVHRATFAHSRELHMTRVNRERSASPKGVRGSIFDERDYQPQRSRVSGYDSDYPTSKSKWRRSEAKDYHSSYYRSGDNTGEHGVGDYLAYHHQSNLQQEKPSALQHGSAYREPARRQRSGVEGYGFPIHRPEKRGRSTIADNWRPSN